MIREGTVEEIQEILFLIPEFIDPYPKEEFEKRLKAQKTLILIAEEEKKLIGFKCGYERNRASFYSWMGGVLPEHRRKGVAKGLLKEMEAWCRVKGYKTLTFKTLNRHKSMLQFAIRNDFEIADVEKSNKDALLRIWLSKEL